MSGYLELEGKRALVTGAGRVCRVAVIQFHRQMH
jgi:hypothetical protein